MSPTGWAWACLLCPLAGMILIGLTWRALPWRVHGILGTVAIFAAFVCAVLAFFGLQDRNEEQRQLVSVAFNYANTAGIDAKLALLVDPLSVFMMLVVSGVSALIFSIGAGGVLIRRNPLVILLCLELMLNAGNLALVGFARMWGNGDGQLFAIIVMVVAACEVCIGLGLVVAIYRRRLPIDVDELRELQG